MKQIPFSLRFISIRLTSVIAVWVVLSPVCVAEEIRFNTHIRPILAEHCLPCHGPDAEKREADLRLDFEEVAKEHAIVPGKPDESEVFQRIVSEDPDLKMPPEETGKSLNQEQVTLIRQWIASGAKYESHWAYQRIRDPAPPHINAEELTEVDRFIVDKLNRNGLTLSPRISRQQLIRRATFDLTGLPPTWDEVEAFVADTSPEAFARVIERLLDAPAYGERWGRHWLDIARYADTHGGAAIGFTRFPFSYTYRDYVIDAFNNDLPYDQFVTEQLAADQMGFSENAPALAALGFLTVGMQYRNPHDVIDDQIDVVTRGMLGLTVACARCHDHKYDAIPTEDYYSLYATLASSRSPERLPVIGQPADTEPFEKYQSELAGLQVAYDDMAREQNAVMRGRLRMQVGLYLREVAKGTPEQDLSAAFLSFRTDDLRPHVLHRWQKYMQAMTEDDSVFGPWVRFSQLKEADFANRCHEIVESLTKENGDLSKQPELRMLSAKAPRWNPRVLDALTEKKPTSMLEVADVYGQLFADIHQQWLRVLLATSLEAVPGKKPVPDENPEHSDVNSPVNRQLRRHLYRPDTPTNMPDELASKLLNRPINDSLNGRKGAIHNLDLASPGSPPRAMALREDENTEQFHVLTGGSPIDRGKPVKAKFLSAFNADNLQPFAPGSRRLGLAKAIANPANPLTRRVIVNWVWQRHFGRGLVRTPDDFGTRGKRPTHPQLLDYLATKLLDDGWSLKKLHRRIMFSSVYQQASTENTEARTKDPDNELLWRMPRRRLDLEAMRDAMLAVSGELQPTMGGRPFEWLSSPVVPRRSVYAFVNRDIVSPLASTFDAANPNACTAKRPETTVPQQTLFALNSEFIQDRAAALATRKELALAQTDSQRVRLLYQRAFSREPKPHEVKTALVYIHSQGENKANTDAWQRLAHVLLASNEFVFVD